MAKLRMPPNLWDFVAGGAGDEITLRQNRTAFEQITINPRFLVDVDHRDLSTTVLGRKISFPVMLAPAAGQSWVCSDEELATARAAGAADTIMVLTYLAGYSLEAVAEAATGPLWLQIYHSDDETTKQLTTRAKAAGYAAICLTVDGPIPSPKERDVRNRFVPQREAHSGSQREAGENVKSGDGNVPAAGWTPPGYHGLTWSRLKWLRGLTDLPLVVKGIRGVEDAVLCADHGVDAIVVSNHGARQLDSTLSSIETLPAIAEAVGDRLEVYMDSGIRRGLDVIKALALGARAVLMGRPIFWGLAVDGEHGVRRALEILRTEFDHAMAFCGRTDVAAIDSPVVSMPYHWRAGG